MYDKYLETNAEAKRQHNESQKKAAATRLAEMAKKRKQRKQVKEQ
jgi:hypothetical protein